MRKPRKRKCEYCGKPNKTIVSRFGVSAFVGAHRLVLRFDNVEPEHILVSFELINFCPMCGRKLEDVKS